MPESVQLAIIAVIASLCTGTIVVAVGVWADGRRKRADAGLVTAANEHNELVKVRMEYRERIERLEKRLDDKDAQISALQQSLSDARVIVAQQAARITDLEEDLASLHKEREARP